MFTGLVFALGKVSEITAHPGGIRWTIDAPKITNEIKQGDSVNVSGCCQTVEAVVGDSFSGTSIQETMKATNFGDWVVGSPVNLELALRASDRFGGHFVTGHVDCAGTVKDIRTPSDGHWVDIAFDLKYDRWVLNKGSIAIDGVSLTVMEKQSGLVTVSFIPETITRTTLGVMRLGQRVNIEFDMLVKAVVPELSADHAEESFSKRSQWWHAFAS